MLLAALIINISLVAITVIIHYEILRMLSNIIPRMRIRLRLRVVFGVFGTICAHIVEVGLFGVAFYLMVHQGSFGELSGNFNGSLVDSIYFSFINYTTVGYGDIVPTGSLRFLAGLEAITGLSLITWSASFMFMEMTMFWDKEGADKKPAVETPDEQ